MSAVVGKIKQTGEKLRGSLIAKGDDGFSPVVEVVAEENGYLVKITDAQGDKTFRIINGKIGYSIFYTAKILGFVGETTWLLEEDISTQGREIQVGDLVLGANGMLGCVAYGSASTGDEQSSIGVETIISLASASVVELVDIRVDVNGKVHASAGAAVRAQAEMAKTVFDMTLKKVECVNLLPPTFTAGSLEDDGVTPKASSSSATSEFFPVEPGKKIAYTRMVTATTRMIDGPWSFFFYDANKTVISIVKQPGALLPRVAVDIPENAAYARVIIHSSLNSASYRNMVEYTEDGTTISAAFVEYFEPYYERLTQSALEGKNICVLGDSLAANGNGGIDTWIQRVADSLGCSKAYNRGASGSRVTNRDVQGNPAIRYAYIDSQGEAYNRMSYATQQTVSGYTEIDASGCSVERANTIPTDTDVVIILMGANDVGLTTIDYFKEDYRTMLDNIQTRVPSAEIYLCTMPFHVAFDTGAAADAYEKYRQAIRDAGLEYGYPVIDLKAEMQVNKNNYASFMDADNIHYNNTAGRNRTAKTVKSALIRFN